MDRYEAQLHSRASSKALEVARVMIRDKFGFEAQIADRGPPRRRKKDRGSLGHPKRRRYALPPWSRPGPREN
jgi:hypothetical protein